MGGYDETPEMTAAFLRHGRHIIIIIIIIYDLLY